MSREPVSPVVTDLDWQTTPIGPQDQWPANLKALADLIQAAAQPMLIAWGRERTLLYNDAYIPILGAKHPAAFGKPFFEVWPDVNLGVRAQFDQVFEGVPVVMAELTVALDRGGGPDEAQFSFSYTPIVGVGGEVAGLFGVCSDITSEVAGRKALDRERVRQQRLLQEMPGFVAILAGPDHAFQYVNDAFVTLTGHRSHAGRPVREVFPDVEGQGFFQLLDQVYTTGERFSARAAPVQFDGEPHARFIDLNFEAIRDDSGLISGVFVGGYDVTDAERGAKALRKSDDLLAALVMSSEDAIISKTTDGKVTSWNRGAERVFGYLAEEMIGQPISILAMPGHEDEMPAILDRIKRSERVEHFETERRHKSGAAVLVSLSVSPIHDEAGSVIGASKVARDITAVRQSAKALKLAEARLHEQHRELLHAARLGELGQMAAALGHEINQPLSAILNYLHAAKALLNQDDPSERAMLGEAIQLAAGQAMRAAEVVRRLRGFAKPNDGLVQPESINQILEETVALAGIDVGRRGVAVKVSFSPGPDTVLADRVSIQQVILNLVRNGLEAMEGQSGGELILSTTASPEGIVVAVEDTGPGLAAEVRARLFEPFVTTKDNGMGIGLSICRKIIDTHAGRFWAEDRPGGGTAFRFALPHAETPGIAGEL